MKKLFLIITVLFSFNAKAVDYKAKIEQELAKHNIKAGQISKKELIEVLNKIQEKATIKGSNAYISEEQLKMMSQAYEHLKNKRIEDPELRKAMNHAVKIIEQSKVLK